MILAITFSTIALACYLALGVVAVRQKVRGRTNQAFVLYLAAMTFWQFTALMVSSSRSAASALVWYRFMTAGLTGQFIFYLLFTLVFLGLERQRGWFYAGWLSFVVLLASSGTNLIIESVSKSEVTGLYVPHLGPLVPIVAITTYTFFCYGIYVLMQRYRKTKSSLQRNRIRYLLLGAAAIAIGSPSNVVPVLQGYPIDVAANVVNAVLIAYAILRYQLLDITVVVRKGLLYSVPTIIIGAGYFLLISLAMRLFHAFAGPQILLLSALVAIMTAVVAQPLRDRAQLWVDRLFFREKYDSRLMLQRVSHTAASVLDLDRLTGMILDELTTTIHIERAAFFLKRGETGEFRLVDQRGLDDNVALKLRKDHPIVDWLSNHESALTRHDMEMVPQFKALWGQEREELERMQAELFIPLEAKGELVGILAVGPKLSEESYSQDDQLTLTTLANQVAVAIENARLYERVERSLEQLIALRQTSLDITARLHTTALLEAIVQRAAELLKAKGGGVYLCDPTRQELTVAVDYGLKQSVVGTTLKLGEGMSGQVAQTGRPMIVDDYRTWPGRSNKYAEDLFTTVIEVPLKWQDQVIGTLAIVDEVEERAFTEDDAQLLSLFADQATIAIENARLYDATQRELAERRRAEATLKEYSERLEDMVEQRTEELRDAQVRLIQSEKLAATGRLAASVAHEINNPLQGIGNYLSLISQQVAQDDPLHEDLDMVKLGFDRIAEIVRRLRAFYRPAGEAMEPTDINGVVERVLALVGHQLALGNIEVKTELAKCELPVLGSAGQLEQVLINLALNAQEAMTRGGELTVRTTLHNNVVQLQMSDTGHGISEEKMGGLFKPFYSEKGGTGLGLGLWISHNIIEGHGGSIEVESQVGEGATFTISLPAYQRER